MKTDNIQKKYLGYSYAFFLLPLIALIGPIVLIPIEKVLPYPYILEEIVKVIMVFLILSTTGKIFQIKLATFAGFFFALSENIFYLSSPNLYTSPDIFLKRFFLVSLLHIITILAILIPSQKYRFLILPATLIAMFIHYFYNQNIMLFFQ